jgi:hypothetical protein
MKVSEGFQGPARIAIRLHKRPRKTTKAGPWLTSAPLRCPRPPNRDFVPRVSLPQFCWREESTGSKRVGEQAPNPNPILPEILPARPRKFISCLLHPELIDSVPRLSTRILFGFLHRLKTVKSPSTVVLCCLLYVWRCLIHWFDSPSAFCQVVRHPAPRPAAACCVGATFSGDP